MEQNKFGREEQSTIQQIQEQSRNFDYGNKASRNAFDPHGRQVKNDRDRFFTPQIKNYSQKIENNLYPDSRPSSVYSSMQPPPTPTNLK